MQEKRICPEHGEVRHYLPPEGGAPVCIVCRRVARAAHRTPAPTRQADPNQHASWRSRNREYLRQRSRAYSRSLPGAAYILWYAAGERAKRARLVFAITQAEVEALLRPAVESGAVTLEKHDPRSASLDRIDSARGYVAGNVEVVPAWYGFGKNKYGEAAFRAVVLEWANNQQTDSWLDQ